MKIIDISWLRAPAHAKNWHIVGGFTVLIILTILSIFLSLNPQIAEVEVISTPAPSASNASCANAGFVLASTRDADKLSPCIGVTRTLNTQLSVRSMEVTPIGVFIGTTTGELWLTDGQIMTHCYTIENEVTINAVTYQETTQPALFGKGLSRVAFAADAGEGQEKSGTYEWVLGYGWQEILKFHASYDVFYGDNLIVASWDGVRMADYDENPYSSSFVLLQEGKYHAIYADTRTIWAGALDDTSESVWIDKTTGEIKSLGLSLKKVRGIMPLGKNLYFVGIADNSTEYAIAWLDAESIWNHALLGSQIKAIIFYNGYAVVGGSDGLWLERNINWDNLSKLSINAVAVLPDGTLLAGGERGIIKIKE